MEPYLYLVYAIGLLVNGYIFWFCLQLALASWGSKKAPKEWITIVNSPIMQLSYVKWGSTVLTIVMAFQLICLTLLVCLSIYTGEPLRNL